jgi:L-lactate dehydrogenase complex protein LldG
VLHRYTNLEDTATIDVTVVRSPLGVAETGSVLLSEAEVVINAVGLMAHDIVVLPDPADIVHDAYVHRYFRESGYCLLMTGPSGSADIGGVEVNPGSGQRDPDRRLRATQVLSYDTCRVFSS